jgi:hypothetical protein
MAANTRDFRCWCPLTVLRSLGVVSSLLSDMARGIRALAHDDSPPDRPGQVVPQVPVTTLRSALPPASRCEVQCEVMEAAR